MPKFAFWLSMGVGFLSLSQEILWVRAVSFLMRGATYSFSLVLLLFLAGIALGAAYGKRLCERNADLYRASMLVLALAAVVDFSVLGLLPKLAASVPGFVGICALVMVTAALKSVMFPIAHHLGSNQTGAHLGRSVSKVYFGNIIGSTLGPIVTGYGLLNLWSLEACLAMVGAGTAALAVLCGLRAADRRLLVPLGATLASVTLAVLLAADGMVQRIATTVAPRDQPGATVSRVIQNRQGIIHILSKPGHADVVQGGGAYDGRLSTDMRANENGLDRALVMFAVHPNPERVLVIGMSGGAWTRIVSSSPQVKSIVVVEINPGYLELIKSYPEMAPVLTDPRVHVVIDDGRRWLRRNPSERFDLIVQNTTFHWRAYSTNLLSREYMQLAARHLRPGGIIGMNSTLSADALRTAQSVFGHVERRHGFIFGSDRDFSSATNDAAQRLAALQLEEHPIFDAAAFAAGGTADEILRRPFVPAAQRFEGLHFARPQVVTDQNLLVEHAHGYVGLHERLPALYEAIDTLRGAPAGPAPGP